MPERIGNSSVCLSSSTSRICSSPRTGFTAVWYGSSSTQCSISMGGFWFPAHDSLTLAKNGLSVVPETTKGGSLVLNGVAKEEGGGSVMHVTVRSCRKAEMCSDYQDTTKHKQETER